MGCLVSMETKTGQYHTVFEDQQGQHLHESETVSGPQLGKVVSAEDLSKTEKMPLPATVNDLVSNAKRNIVSHRCVHASSDW